MPETVGMSLTDAMTMAESLELVYGAEWADLMTADRAAILSDALSTLDAVRRSNPDVHVWSDTVARGLRDGVGRGNLASYARCLSAPATVTVRVYHGHATVGI